MPQQHPDGQEDPAEPEPPAPKPPWLIRHWLSVRAGLQLAELLPEEHQGLRLAAQTLVVAGDLVVFTLTQRDR